MPNVEMITKSTKPEYIDQVAKQAEKKNINLSTYQIRLQLPRFQKSNYPPQIDTFNYL